MSQDKTQPAVNGYSLNKGCNTVLGYLRASLRASTVDLLQHQCVLSGRVSSVSVQQ